MLKNKWEVERDKKTCYFDIDGVLNNYPKCWLQFIREHPSGIESSYGPIEDLNTTKNKIPYQMYKNLKWEYRESGYKETLPVNSDAANLTSWLARQGYYIVIITSRPVKEHPSLFKQTTNWLDKNHIEYNDLLFNPEKHISVLSRYPHLSFGIEDHRYYANLVASWGYKMFLLDNQYNRGEIHSNVMRIDNLIEAAQVINSNKTY